MLTSRLILSTAAAATIVGAADAQQTRSRSDRDERQPMVRTYSFSARDDDRPRLGIGTTAGSTRDTLGLLVSDVTKGGPADKAGIEEGDRLVSVNGVSLKISTADVDDEEMAGVASRRLIRELGKLKIGDAVDLRVYREGQTRNVKVNTVGLDDLEPQRATVAGSLRAREDRASLGVGLGGSTSRRDTLGVLVSSVVDDGPADKAKIEEGDRIASINGVDLRVASADAGDWASSSSRMRRLTREMEKVKVGDEVELRLIRGGQARTVRVKSVAAKDLPNSSGFTIGGDGSFFSDGNGFSFSGPGARGNLRISPPNFDGSNLMFFDRSDDGRVRMRLSPERQAEIEGRVGDLMRRFNGGHMIVRPRSGVRIVEPSAPRVPGETSPKAASPAA